MEQDILISVIVPVYNVEAYLNKCVDSILAQTYRNLEIILVDDGTKDASDRICDAYAAADSRVRVIHKENGGLSSARNAGIDIARGEYLGFVDSDDWIEPEMYESMLALAMETNCKLVCAGRYDVDGITGDKQIGLCPPSREVVSGEELVRRIFRWENLDSAAWDKLYHRSLFASRRYPVGKIVEDVPVTYLIALEAERAAMLNKPVYNYLHRAGSITTSSVSDKTFHFVEHTAVIYPWIRENRPGITREARYLRVRSLIYSIRSVDLADQKTYETYRGRSRGFRRELRSHVPFLLTCPLFGWKERLTDLLLACGLYRPVYGLYKCLK